MQSHGKSSRSELKTRNKVHSVERITSIVKTNLLRHPVCVNGSDWSIYVYPKDLILLYLFPGSLAGSLLYLKLHSERSVTLPSSILIQNMPAPFVYRTVILHNRKAQ